MRARHHRAFSLAVQFILVPDMERVHINSVRRIRVMSQPVTTTLQASSLALGRQAGIRLKQIHRRIGLTLRQVEVASLEIADAERNSECVVSTARLNQIDNDGSLSSMRKFYT